MEWRNSSSVFYMSAYGPVRISQAEASKLEVYETTGCGAELAKAILAAIEKVGRWKARSALDPAAFLRPGEYVEVGGAGWFMASEPLIATAPLAPEGR